MVKARPDLSVTVGDLKLKNPLIMASGPCGRVARGLIKYTELGFAAVVTKTITPEPWGGNPAPRDIVVAPDTLLESSGLPNVGLKAMIPEINKAKEEIKDSAFVVPNITAEEPEQFAEMAFEFEKAGADAIEIAIFGCPNYMGRTDTRISTRYWEQTPDRVETVVKAVRNAIKIPIWVKFTTRNVECIKAMERAGASAVHTAGGGSSNFAIDVDTGKPWMGNPCGTGTAHARHYKYAGYLIVMDLLRTVQIPVLADGGIWEGKDVIEYTLAGATGAQVCTSVMLKGPKWVKHILDGIEEYMVEKGYSSLDEIRGITRKYLHPDIRVFR